MNQKLSKTLWSFHSMTVIPAVPTVVIKWSHGNGIAFHDYGAADWGFLSFLPAVDVVFKILFLCLCEALHGGRGRDLGFCAGLNFGCRGSSRHKTLESFFPHLCRKLLRGIKRNGSQSPCLPRAWLPKSKHAEPHILVSLELSAGTGRGLQIPRLLKFQMQSSKQALIDRELLQPVPRHESPQAGSSRSLQPSLPDSSLILQKQAAKAPMIMWLQVVGIAVTFCDGQKCFIGHKAPNVVLSITYTSEVVSDPLA